ncbi:MAG TPA: ParB/RepB/Spo0J family partition protein [Candidatus Dormibacteraeota bacterium]
MTTPGGPPGEEVERHLSGRPVRADLRRIPVDRLEPRSDQPRHHIDARGLEELTESIRHHGVLQPIRVRPRGDGYEIIAGERRWRAARRAGLKEIPAIVVEADDDRAYVEALVENIQREELNAVDRAHALKRLRVALNLGSWQQVAELVGITRQHVYNILNVTRLPEAIRDDIRAGDLTEKHARALLRLREEPELQRRLWEEIHTRVLSGRAAEERARVMAPAPGARAASPMSVASPAPAPAPPRVSAPSPSDLVSLATEILATLVTAAPEELHAAAPALTDLHRRLGQVLSRPAR